MEQTLARSMARIIFAAATAATAAGITACGGGGSSPAPAPAPAPAPSAGPTADEAARFLTQATFGPTDAEIAKVQAIGYSAWIDEQFAMPATPHLPYVQANYHPRPERRQLQLHAGLVLATGDSRAGPAAAACEVRAIANSSSYPAETTRSPPTPMAWRTTPICSGSMRSATTGN